MTWWTTSTQGDEKSFVVVDFALHDLPRWERDILARFSVMMSQAMRGQMEMIQQNHRITFTDTEPQHVSRAELLMKVNEERAGMIRKLLDQEKYDDTGTLLPFSNAYRFTSCNNIGGGQYQAISCLAQGEWKEGRSRGGIATIKHSLNKISATTGLQQVLQTYLQHPAVMALPRELRSGNCQEVAQQTMSYIGQLESTKVKNEVSFPTVEDRDPTMRRAMYELAIDDLVGDLRRLNRVRLRDKYPADYAEDDPRGDREIVDDERWFAITRSPEPHQIPLFFVNGKAVTLLQGRAHFDAGISKRNRHRGVTAPSDVIRASRPQNIQHKGYTSLNAWYAELPLLDTDDPVIQEILRKRDELHASNSCGKGRDLDLGLIPMPIMHQERWKPKQHGILVPLSGDRSRLERILNRGDLEIAWSRLVCKNDEWHLQLTLRVATPKSFTKPIERILGVSFGIDAIATWTLIDANDIVLQQGAFAPNEQIKTFMTEKAGLEWNQEKKRWVGGRGARFAKRLESIAHGVVNKLITLAQSHGAQLALEDISWVPKQSRDHAQNMLFTAWNYGQLRRYGEYKAPLAHLDTPVFISDFRVNFTCPNCGACRSAGQSQERATTWRENGTLHCRSCSAQTVLTAEHKSVRVALEGLAFRQRRTS